MWVVSICNFKLKLSSVFATILKLNSQHAYSIILIKKRLGKKWLKIPWINIVIAGTIVLRICIYVPGTLHNTAYVRKYYYQAFRYLHQYCSVENMIFLLMKTFQCDQSHKSILYRIHTTKTITT